MNEPSPEELAALAEDVLFGYGDRRINTGYDEMDTNDYWVTKLAPPAQVLRADGVGYRQHMQQTSSSLIYSAGEWYGERQQARPDIYERVPAKQLGDYASAEHRSKWLPRDGESAANFAARLRPVIGHLETELAPELYAEVVEAYNTCIEAPDSFQAFRKRQVSKQSGESVGIFGQDAKALATELSAKQQADYEARFMNNPSYNPVGPAVPTVNIAGVLKAEADPRGQAVAARYAHGDLRPSGGNFRVTS